MPTWVMDVAKWAYENYTVVVAGVSTVIGGVIAIALVVPGTEPEATLQKVLDWLKQFSRK